MKLESLSPQDIEDFKSHPVWQVINGDLEEMREFIRSDLEEAPIDDVIIEDSEDKSPRIVKGVRKLQGAASILKYLIGLPDMMIAELKSMEDVKNEREEGRTDSGN